VRLHIEDVNALDERAFVELFGPVFEGSPWIAEEASAARPFDSQKALHNALCDSMYSAPTERKLALILAHPDLAGKAAVAGEITSESASEQATAGLDRLSPEEYEAFTGMNAAYREKFEMPMIVCVREHDKESILREASVRLKNSREQEIETALAEISKIARYRLQDLVEPDESGGET
jgi:OHCU decarboxylase